jgi:hypothetical protein
LEKAHITVFASAAKQSSHYCANCEALSGLPRRLRLLAKTESKIHGAVSSYMLRKRYENAQVKDVVFIDEQC